MTTAFFNEHDKRIYDTVWASAYSANVVSEGEDRARERARAAALRAVGAYQEEHPLGPKS